MYLEHFGLRELPFSLTPDTSFYYRYSSHQEALETLLVALQSGEGFIKVSGEVGLGKTLLCRKLLNKLGDPFITAYMPNPHLSPGAMRQAIADEFRLELPARATQDAIVRALTRKLIELAEAGKRPVVVLDEAQELPTQTLEAVRLLTNLETEKRKLLQVVLFGQPELDQRLNEKGVRQLKQRITFSYKLRPLSEEAVGTYVAHRLQVAGYRGRPLFESKAVRRIFKASRGTPRLVNILAHKCLLAAYGRGDRHVDAQHASLAVRDTEGAFQRRAWWPLLVAGTLSGIAVAALWLASESWGGWLP